MFNGQVKAGSTYCADPLNLQTRTDTATSSAGVVTCASGYTKCGVIYNINKKIKKNQLMVVT